MGELFGVRIPSPREMFDGTVAAGASTAQSVSDGPSRLGGSALEQASNLGRAIDTGVRDAGRVVDGAIGDAQAWAQNGVRDGVHWTGQQIHAGAEVVRKAVGDDTLAGQVVGGGVTWAENNARFSVGLVGGVANEAVGLVGTVAAVASTGVQMQLSPTRRDEVGAAVAQAVGSGADAVYRYGQTVAADPSRLLSDAQAAGQGVVDHYQTAIADGRGPEAFGMTAGQVLTYVVPVGAGANVARAGLGGATRAVGVEVAETTLERGAAGVLRADGLAVRAADDVVEAASKPVVALSDRTAYRAATKAPEPNTLYSYDGFTFETDALGRGVSSSGELSLGNGGNRFYDDRLQGYPHNPDALPGDIGFHAGADQFGFPGGALNIFPGNSQLNSAAGAYGRFENTVLRPLIEERKTVHAQFDRVFYEGNVTGRPDELQIVYRVGDGPPKTTTFLNRADQ